MNTFWMGYELKSPIVLASLTPISHSRIEEHCGFIKNAFKYGAGAVVLGSINPSYVGNPDINYTQNDLLCINTDLYKDSMHESMMAISLIGPPFPNLTSVEYGVNLMKTLKREVKDGVIIGSIINSGTIDEIEKTAERLIENGANAIELNLSCPNINNEDSKISTNEVTFELIKKIYGITNKPLSLKFSPASNYDFILNNEKIMKMISGLTINNAYLGLVPPDIVSKKSPFKRSDYWSPSGIYGPFERMLTYHSLYSIQRKTKHYGIDISCVGGLVDGNHVIEAILLGASTIQLSSGVLWKSAKLIEESRIVLEQYMKEHNYESIVDFKGKSLDYIVNVTADIIEYQSDGKKLNYQMPTPYVIDSECNICLECVDCGCLAISYNENISNKININKELCSGCGFCIQKCRFGAIQRTLKIDANP